MGAGPSFILSTSIAAVLSSYFTESNFNKIKGLKDTRLTYNWAHLRSTKETLTNEYFRIILEKNQVKIFWVKIFWGENFWGENFLGENLFWVKFLGENFLS